MNNSHYDELLKRLKSTFSGFAVGTTTTSQCVELDPSIPKTVFISNDLKDKFFSVEILKKVSLSADVVENKILIIMKEKEQGAMLPLNIEKLNLIIDHEVDPVKLKSLEEMKKFFESQAENVLEKNSLNEKIQHLRSHESIKGPGLVNKYKGILLLDEFPQSKPKLIK